MAVAVLGFGHVRIRDFDAAPVTDSRTVAVAQPNVDLALKWDKSFTDSTFSLINRLCEAAMPVEPVLIVFPETAAPIYIRHDKKHSGTMGRIALDNKTQVYIGFLDGRHEGPNKTLRVFNSSGVFDFRQPNAFAQYDKTHLLPFGEAFPYAWKFDFLSNVDFGQANFRPGPDRQPLPTDAGAIGPMICFESIFPYLARNFVRDGAEVLVNITNDGWFGRSAGPEQHNAMAIVRAVENKRYLLRSANTGVSMVVDPMGRVVTSLDLHEDGVIIARIQPLQERTPFTRWGNLPATLACVVMVLVGGFIGRLKIAR
jgi:apolipoprotein N-acyltransferase